ncbi:hypothetical protein AAFC00_004069 [Neodothiora populina]|uniref:CAF1-domain-containing protein n=1 Tax=Neodothiora populina TaxID=2781224 RepID=A0ABR3PIF6_9PEZI
MDVDKVAFRARFLDILLAIGEASYVSFDLELSGVPVKQPGGGADKPTLQERYLETKQAAETFQILQVGLTCVKGEYHSGVYLCKPYNFNISPVIDERRLDVDRTFSFHSGAVDFLLGVGFRIDLPFTSGIPYLSRSEAILAHEIALARNDRSTIADINVKPEDAQSIAFLRRVRKEIDAWLKLDQSSLLVSPLKENGRPVDPELSRFERRLVHQLVRAEYPKLVTIPAKGMVRILKYDQEREDRIKAERLRDSQERIDRQTGFRWLIEALIGNPPRNLDVKQFAVSPETGEAVPANLDEIRSKYHRAQRLLANKKTVLVGHNLFLDLIYVYKAFIGPLPDHVDDFVALIHDLFPLIIDTKYMATHNCGDINPRSSLEEIAEQLSLQQFPLLETHREHNKYQQTSAFHEAGYDSLLTAQVAARLSTKLEAAGSYIEESSDVESPGETGGVRLNGAAANFTSQSQNSFPVSTLSGALDGLKGLVIAPLKTLTQAGRTQNQEASGEARNLTQPSTTSGSQGGSNGRRAKEKLPKRTVKPDNFVSKKPNTTSPAPLPGRFAHSTIFEQLQDDSETPEEEAAEEDEVIQFDDLPTSATASAPVVADTDGVSGDVVAPEDWDTPYWRRSGGKAMPRFDTDFWDVYGNKLRVFGCQEGVCLLHG